jgi:hypothetical protein
VLLISAAAVAKVTVFLISRLFRSSGSTLESAVALILAVLFSSIAVLLILAVGYSGSGVVPAVIAGVGAASVTGAAIGTEAGIEG